MANYIKQDEIWKDYRTIAYMIHGKQSGSNIRVVLMGTMKKFASAMCNHLKHEQDPDTLARNPDFQRSIAPLLHMAYSEIHDG
jgi:hypothetical protein